MELYEVMRTTFSAREFTSDPLPDETLVKILDHARFAPSGGNRQGWKVIVVRDPGTRRALADLSGIAAKRYTAQAKNGENPWNTIDPPGVDAATIERTPAPPHLTESIAKAPVVLARRRPGGEDPGAAGPAHARRRVRGHAARPPRPARDEAEAEARGGVRDARAVGRASARRLTGSP